MRPRTLYVIAIGSNRRGRHGTPVHEVAAAIEQLTHVVAVSAIVASDPIGPSTRRFANAVAVIDSIHPPPDLLHHLKTIEARFGRRAGRRWGARVIDLDIILWSGGIWASPALTIPHPAFRARRFVLAPLVGVAPRWRDPISNRSVRQLLHAVDRPRPRA
ncbi:MAG: 2-amino-4-hydroxy-6-hydroxymethyldihydropteridine diphosphokinase [Pseudomonadota bacterium]|nr:2-amino-4-hydroxy-6-hydroxymethyldihydropteridine diphosphokinase [Pseudomonadota bacterium]